jgi:hypothetical protein
MKNFEAIQYIYPEAKFSMINDDLSTIVWVDGDFDIPTKAQIDAATAALEAEVQSRADLKASAKAKLIAGSPLTAEEADTLIL